MVSLIVFIWCLFTFNTYVTQLDSMEATGPYLETPFTLTNFFLPMYWFRLKGLLGSESLAAWYKSYERRGGPGPSSRLVQSYAENKMVQQQLAQGMANNSIKRGNALGLFVLNKELFPEIGYNNLGFSNRQHSVVRPVWGEALDGAERRNKTCDGSACWNGEWLRNVFAQLIEEAADSNHGKLEDSDIGPMIQLVAHKIALDLDITLAEAKEFYSLGQEFVAVAQLPQGVADKWFMESWINDILARKASWTARYEEAIKLKWANHGFVNNKTTLEWVRQGWFDALALSVTFGPPGVVQRIIAFSYSTGKASLMALGRSPKELLLNETLLGDVIWESLRLWPGVATSPIWTRTSNSEEPWRRLLLSYFPALIDPKVFPDPLEFKLGRPGLNAQDWSLSIGFMDFAMVNGNVSDPSSRSCPARMLALAIVKAFIQALVAQGPWVANIDRSSVFQINMYATTPLTLSINAEWNALPIPNLVPGILVGVLCLVTTLAAVYFTMLRGLLETADAVNEISKQPSAKWLKLAMVMFAALNGTSAILTLFFSGVDLDDNVMTRWYGYNNICILYDFPPATYVAPMFWAFVLAPFSIFIYYDEVKLYKLTMPLPVKAIAMAVNGLGFLSVMVFTTIFAIHPYDNMLAHSLPFAGLILMFPTFTFTHLLVAYLYVEQTDVANWKLGLSGAWVMNCIIYEMFVLHALLNGPNAYWYTPAFQTLDYMWVAFAFLMPFVLFQAY